MSNEQSIRDAVGKYLQGLGLTDRPAIYGDGIHGWRCEYPDRYGQCDCFDEAITGLLTSPAIRRIRAETWDQAVEEQRLLAPAHEAEVPRNPYIEQGETA